MSEPLHNFNEQLPRIGAHSITRNAVEIMMRYDELAYLGNAVIEYKQSGNPASLRGEIMALFAINLGSISPSISEKVLMNLISDLVEVGTIFPNKEREVQGLICFTLGKMPGLGDIIIGQAREMMEGFKKDLGITVSDETIFMNPLADNREAYYLGSKRVDKFLMITDGMAELDCIAIPSQERLELARELFGFNQLFTFAISAIKNDFQRKISADISAKPTYVPT